MHNGSGLNSRENNKLSLDFPGCTAKDSFNSPRKQFVPTKFIHRLIFGKALGGVTQLVKYLRAGRFYY